MQPLTPESLQKAREMVCSAGKRLLSEGLVSGTWGNISCRLNDEYIIITLSGRDYKELTTEDMALVKINDINSTEFTLAAEWELHAEIYKHRNEINAIIQTCSNNFNVVGITGHKVPPLLDDMAQIIGPSIRVAGYAISGTRKLIKPVIKALAGRNAAILTNHGAICLGRDLDEALVTCEILEKSCRTYIESELMGGGVPVGGLEAWIMHQYFLRKYSKQKKV